MISLTDFLFFFFRAGNKTQVNAVLFECLMISSLSLYCIGLCKKKGFDQRNIG